MEDSEIEEQVAAARQVILDKLKAGETVVIDIPVQLGTGRDNWWPAKIKIEGGGIWRWAE